MAVLKEQWQHLVVLQGRVPSASTCPPCHCAVPNVYWEPSTTWPHSRDRCTSFPRRVVRPSSSINVNSLILPSTLRHLSEVATSPPRLCRYPQQCGHAPLLQFLTMGKCSVCLALTFVIVYVSQATICKVVTASVVSDQHISCASSSTTMVFLASISRFTL